MKVRSCPLITVERMDDEFTKMLQGCDCHSTEYVTRYLTNYLPIFRVNSIHNFYFRVRNLILRVLTTLGGILRFTLGVVGTSRVVTKCSRWWFCWCRQIFFFSLKNHKNQGCHRSRNGQGNNSSRSGKSQGILF